MKNSIAVPVEWHPAACIFPMIEDAELQALADDIAKHGLREPILMLDGKVLDGRNRFIACKMAQVPHRFEEFTGTPMQALDLVWSRNFTRRDLNSSQRAVIEQKRLVLSEEYAAGVKQTQAAQPKGGRPKKAEKPPQTIGEVNSKHRETDHKRATAAGTNRTYIKAAEKIAATRPDLIEKIEKGKLTIPQATAEIKRQEKTEDLERKSAAAKSLRDDQPLWTLMNVDVMIGLQSIIDNHGEARLVFADPPYNIGVDYGDGAKADLLPNDVFHKWCEEWLALCRDCLSADGSIWLMASDEFAAEACCALKRLGMYQRNWIKWYETFGVNCSTKFNRTSRHILYFTNSVRDCVWNPEPVSRPSDRQAKYNDKRAAANGKVWDDVWQIPRLSGTCDERIPSFPTQLPLAIVEPIVLCASEPGDLVVDPFNGSGTTGVAAVRNSRKYIGIDKSEAFVSLAEKRLVIT